MAAPTMKQWVVDHPDKNMGGLSLIKASIPRVGVNEVLVKFQAAALNYRDCAIAKVK
jgi:NADPH:quinone reductase-like Zn-dependent oxidoreductase